MNSPSTDQKQDAAKNECEAYPVMTYGFPETSMNPRYVCPKCGDVTDELMCPMKAQADDERRRGV